MKNTMALILVALVAGSLLIACTNPMGDEVIGNGGGLLTITIGGNSRKLLS